MNDYFYDLLYSAFPVPEWAVFLLWFVFFAGANLLHLKSRALLAAQSHVSVTEPPLTPALSARLVLLQIAFAVLVFACAHFIGSFGFVAIAGGWTVTTAVSFALNLQNTLHLAARSKPGAADGAIQFSNRFATQDKAFQMFGGATLCFCTGLLIAHLALLCGALFLAATGIGYLRKAKAGST